jgi:hypothetical protein
MAARTLPAVSPQAADGQAAMRAHDAPGDLAALRAAKGLPPGLPVTRGTPDGNPGHALSWMSPAGDNMIVAGTASGHRGTLASHVWAGGPGATHPACRALTVPGGRSWRVGG